MDDQQIGYADTFINKDEPRSSQEILDAITYAERIFQGYQERCDTIDAVYGAMSKRYSRGIAGMRDTEYDIFWSSMEIMKPAVYSRMPIPVATTRFKDQNRTAETTSEILERCLNSTFDRGDINQSMMSVRDDLIFSGRGVLWLRYETDDNGNGQTVCIDHKDRCDFLHQPMRKWCDVSWVAGREWLTQQEMHDRFYKSSGDAYQSANYKARTSNYGQAIYDGFPDDVPRCGVWEVWHRGDNKVYWVSEDVEVILDESKPYLDLTGFFPCPRPAFGTLERRTLIPIPDYERYQVHFEQIDELTRRIYDMLRWIRVRGLVPAGGDIGDAIKSLLEDADSTTMLVPIPGASMVQGGVTGFVQFLPVDVWTSAITGLIQARNQLFQDFYQLSGISDIMRGATDAQETLGAQQLKSQYGSIRVKEKIDELQRIAADVARLTGEIMADKFRKDTLLDMAQMELPTTKEIKKQINDFEENAKEELENLVSSVEEQLKNGEVESQGVDPKMIEQGMQERQKDILERYGSLITTASNQVSIDDVMKLLRDDKMRNFIIEIETDSTVLADEMQEKQSRAEFMQAFSMVTTAVAPLLQAGDAGSKLAGAMIKFAIAPFRAGREMEALIDDFVDKAPGELNKNSDDGAMEMQRAMAEAQSKLADAELQKAQAQTAKVEADTAVKMQELQQKQADAQASQQADQQRINLEFEQTRGSIAETQARIQKINAEIQLAMAKLGIEQHIQEREDALAYADIEGGKVDRVAAARNALAPEVIVSGEIIP